MIPGCLAVSDHLRETGNFNTMSSSSPSSPSLPPNYSNIQGRIQDLF
jgi:hypothetical protein